MADGLLPHQIDDFVKLTLPEFKKYKWTDISTEYQHYACSKFFESRQTQESGGPHIDFKIKTHNTGNARNTGMYAQDQTRVEDVMISAKVPWTMQTTNFSYDIYEDMFQGGIKTIIRELVIRDHEAMTSLADLMEDNLWKAPVDSEDNRPYGIPYWIVKNASAIPGGGFTGGNPVGHDNVAGVNSTKHPRWKNWAFGYSAVTIDDLVAKAKKAIAFTGFTPPVPHPETGFGKNNFEIFTTFRVTEPLERIAEKRNDRLGSDVARYANQVTLAGVPMRWIPYLEKSDLSDPLYGINWGALRPFVKTGANKRRNDPQQAPGQHTVRNVHIDHWMNYVCYNRRLCWVGSK